MRSPLEYNTQRIPGSTNLYLLSDEERAVIGKEYVRSSTKMAKSKGVKFVSNRLPYLFDEILEYSREYRNVILYCDRGGYRSKSIWSLLNSLDIKVYRLKDGYKGYRKYIRENLDSLIHSITPVVLAGNTGCGKTKILNILSEKGYPVIDLEGLANHRGSLLGHVGLESQPSQKMFESLLFEELSKYQGKYVFMEGESSKIGSINLPKTLSQNLRNAYSIRIDSSMDHRVSNLVEEYGKPEYRNELMESVKRLEGYISKENINYLNIQIDLGNLIEPAKLLCERYYDIKYKKRIFDKTILNEDEEKSARELIKLYEELKTDAN